MPLQNRVLPTGDIEAIPNRGTMMGNRGGALHGPDRRLGARRWVSRQWICCVLDFKGRHREVMAPHSYTELFFLDETTALAAGHRPCFECRRQAALDFAEHWANAHRLSTRPRAADIDHVLHAQRINGERGQQRHTMELSSLPTGSFYLESNNLEPDDLKLETGMSSHCTPRIVLANHTMAWTPAGYHTTAPLGSGPVEVLTPPGIIAALKSGYRPLLHETAHNSGYWV